MGYAEGGEGNTKRERKEGDNGSRREHDDEEEEEEEDRRSIDGIAARRENAHAQRPSQGSYSSGSPDLKRAETKQQNYSTYNPSPPKRQDAHGIGKGSGSFRDYRDSAVFSDEAQSPIGMLNKLERE